MGSIVRGAGDGAIEGRNGNRSPVISLPGVPAGDIHVIP